jgi:hypothetical protein
MNSNVLRKIFGKQDDAFVGGKRRTFNFFESAPIKAFASL